MYTRSRVLAASSSFAYNSAGVRLGTSVSSRRLLHICATETVPGRKTEGDLGMVFGHTVRSRNIVGNTWAQVQTIWGGEIGGDTRLLQEARKEATARMEEAAQELGADAIVRVQYQCMSGHVTEVMCYGSAVRLAPASSKAA